MPNTTKRKKIALLFKEENRLSKRLDTYDEVYVMKGETKYIALQMDFVLSDQMYYAFNLAAENIDRVMTTLYSKKEFSLFNSIAGNAKGILALKKHVLNKINDLLIFYVVADKLQKEKVQGAQVDIIPNSYSPETYRVIHSLIKEYSGIQVPEWYLKRTRQRNTLKVLAYQIFVHVYPVFLLVKSFFNRAPKKEKMNFKYAVHIWSTYFNSASEWLIEGMLKKGALNKTDTLFINEKPMDKKRTALLRSQGYQTLSLKDAARTLTYAQFKSAIWPQCREVLKQFKTLTCKDFLFIDGFAKAYFWMIHWAIFFEQYSVDQFISNMEPGPTMRSLLQKKHGALTNFIFFTSPVVPCTYKNKYSVVYTYYSLLYFDRLIGNSIAEHFFKNNENYIQEYVNVGTIPADLVYQQKDNKIRREEILKDLGLEPQKKTICFCDISMGYFCNHSDKEGKDFMEDIERLVKANPEYQVVYQPRRNLEYYQKNSLFYQAAKRFASMDQVVYLNPQQRKYKTQEMMAIADMVIVIFGTSACYEPLAAGKKVIAYSPHHHYDSKEYQINQIEGVSVIGYEELEKAFNFWQAHELNSTQIQQIKDKVDPFCDGQAMTRLKAVLEGSWDSAQNINKEDCKKEKEELVSN